jgi:hypothetical protein
VPGNVWNRDDTKDQTCHETRHNRIVVDHTPPLYFHGGAQIKVMLDGEQGGPIMPGRRPRHT